MGDLKLFQIDNDGNAVELKGMALALERPLQVLIEQNMEILFGVRLVASEHSTGKKHGGRIDSLGLDENGSPVIFEYKRARHQPGAILPGLAPRPPGRVRAAGNEETQLRRCRTDRLVEPAPRLCRK